MADDTKNPDGSLDIETVLPPSAGDMEEKKKARKAIRNAAAITLLFSTAVLVGYLSGGLHGSTYHNDLPVIYVIATFITFTFGMALLFLSFVLP